MKRLRILLALLLAAGLSAVWPTSPVQGFKPYSHVQVGDSALGDVLDDGRVTIRDKSYAVRPKIVDALRRWPSYYRAGTIGPDGFPDLTYGQSVIHPDRTGEWMRYVLRSAWAAQHDPAYSSDQKGQILAFAYGFLTHAAGDVWAHTLVNDFSGGVFPEAKEILTSVPKAAIALRHIIVEGYVGDATPGFDGNPERTTLPGGDVSDDSTPAIGMNAPTKWLYRSLIDPRRSLPTGRCGNGEDDDRDGVADDGCAGHAPFTRGKPEQQRGPLIDFFLDLQSDLQLKEHALQTDRKFRDCWIKDPDCYKRQRDVVIDTVRGRRHTTITVQACIGARFGCIASASDFADDKVLTALSENYLEHWIVDIEQGLVAWPNLGLATSRGLFDPQARRDLQNRECAEYGELDAARETCESQIGVTDVVLDQARPFIHHHLLSMLGAPDVTGKVLDIIRALSSFIDSIVGKALNPLRIPLAELEKQAKELILKELRKVVGIDLATLEHMLKNPSVWMETEQIQLDLGKLGLQTVNLFPPGTRDRLDAILGLSPNDRRQTQVPMPDGSTRTVGVLSDQAVYRSAAPIDDAIIMSKMLLLDASGMNKLITDNLVSLGVMKEGVQAQVYRDGVVPANVMVDGLSGGDPWLRLIDGDHAWRQDGLPVFAGTAGHGGNGNFPLWESCLVRPAFAGAFFRDWENGAESFPALGDATSPDWADPTPPTGRITVAAPSYLRKGIKVSDLHRFLGPGVLQLQATDEVFAGSHVTQRVRIRQPNGFSTRDFGEYGEIALTDTDGAGDGDFVVTQRTADPCNPLFQRRSLAFTLDSRDPVADISAPTDGFVADSAERLSVVWDATDPGGHALASGVDRELTQALVEGGAVPDSGLARMFGLYPGEHFVEVVAVDHVGNVGATYRSFVVEATSASLLRNVEQGAASQAFGDDAVRAQLAEQLGSAAAEHTAGDHGAERDALAQARSTLVSGRDNGVIAAWYADLMIAHIDDLLVRHPG